MKLYSTGSSAEQNPPAVQETQETSVRSLGQEGPLEKEIATYSSVLPEKFHGQRSLAGYSSWGSQSQTQLSNYTTTKAHYSTVVYQSNHTRAKHF